MSIGPALRRALTAAVTCSAALLAAAPAGAAAPDQLWSCRASTGYSATPGQDRNEPVVANGSSRTSVESPDRAACADDEARPAAAGQGVDQDGPTARTAIDPDSGLAVDQRVSAQSAANETTSASDGFVLVARGAHAEATGACTGSTPALAGSSRVDRAFVNGQEVDPSQFEEQVYDLPTGEDVHVTFNEQTRAGNALTQRAVHVEFFNQAGQLVRESVVAEAKVGGGHEVCDRAAQEGNDGDGDGDGSAAPCPLGAEYDASRNLCIITRETDGNLANGRETVVIVGRPFEGPSGGRVVPLNEAPRSIRKSACLKGRGAKYLILGTNRRDRITGTNKSDRIFTMRGNDRVSAGRGNDCVEGGRGADQLSGAQGADRVFGGSGRDSLSGGSHADHLYGGPGNDTINTSFGRDMVSAGAGRDAVNAATAGPAARVNCGAGRDTVRSNRNEKRRLRGCERRYSIR